MDQKGLSMKPLPYFPTIILICFVAMAARNVTLGQVRTGSNELRGTVTDAHSNNRLPAVNVFLRGTTIGSSSSSDGTFRLSNLPAGEYDLVFSLVGYERELRHVSLTDSVRLEFNIRLNPSDIRLSQVEVTGSAEEWKKLLPVFTREFLGATNNARNCRILNPEVISLAIGPTGDSLSAHTDGTLILENDALGYRLSVQIDSFLLVSRAPWFVMNCYPRFEEMKPQDEDQLNEWRKRRAECYEYSFTHFLKSVLDQRTRAEEWLVTVGDLRNLHRGRGDELEGQNIRISPFGRSSTLQLDFSSDYIRVDRLDQFGSRKAPIGVANQFYEPTRNTQRSFDDGFRPRDNLEVQTPAEPVTVGSSVVVIRERPLRVDKFGNIVKPYSVTFRGFWATRRLADTLPFDYQPEKEKE